MSTIKLSTASWADTAVTVVSIDSGAAVPRIMLVFTASIPGTFDHREAIFTLTIEEARQLVGEVGDEISRVEVDVPY